MGDLSYFEWGHIAVARSPGASVTKTAILLGISRATVFNVMSTYTNHGKTTAKRNSERKSKLAERVRRTCRSIVSRNHRSTTAQVTRQHNWIFILCPVSTKTARREFRESNIHGNAAMAKHLITASNAQMRKRWCDIRQMETRGSYGQMDRPSRCFLHQEEFTSGEHPW
jgi:predicted transcriptional regulator